MTKTTVKRIPLVLLGSALSVACSKKPESASTPPAPSAPVAAKVAPVTSVNPTSEPFEGEIVVAVKDEAQMKLAPSITYSVKGSNVRYAPAAGAVHAVTDLSAQRVYLIDDAQKSYDAMDVKPQPNAKPAFTVQKTQKTEKIAGLDCENWTIDDGKERVDVCAAKGVPYFALSGDSKPGNVESAWAVALTTEKAFPLRVVVHDKSGKEAYRAEATKADRKKLDESLFHLPAGYKKTDLAKEAKTASLP
jgi:hypothetical protein